MGSADVVAANEIYKVARQQADEELALLRSQVEGVREEAHAMGIVQTLEYQQTHNEMLKYVVLMRLRDAKEHRKSGRTWAQFCEEVIGEPKRTVDLKISEMRPVVEAFGQKFAQIAGLEWRQIRLLGRAIGQAAAQIEDGTVVIGEERIPLTTEHKDDLEAALESLLRSKDAEIAAQKKLVEQKQTTLEKRDAEITALEEREQGLKAQLEVVKFRRLQPTEEEFLKRLDADRQCFDAWLSQFDPQGENPLPDDHTPRMGAAYVEMLRYFERQIRIWASAAIDCYGHHAADDLGWEPPELAPAAPEPAAEPEAEEKVVNLAKARAETDTTHSH